MAASEVGLGSGRGFVKKALVVLIAIASARTALAVDRLELDRRVRALTDKFQILQSQPGKCVPPDILHKAEGLVLLDRTKAGFLFAYQGGGGVVVTRDPKTRAWSPVAFVSANEASLGFQIGGEQNFFVIVLMNTNATRLLTESRFDFAGEARGTAGDVSSGAEGVLDKADQPLWVYEDRKGLYGGVSLKAGALTPDDEANRVYYEQIVTMNDILFDRKVKPTQSSQDLAAKIMAYSRNQRPRP
jgi:lipid-binding SYLF domain-containing protein